jgi:molybdopterin-guanine dinucleotide biosynthesis protein A
MAITGTILAGGENRRIPLLKGHVEINGERIIDSSVNLMRNLFGRAVISTNTPEFYFYCGMPMIGDIINQRGPLTGIFSVLSNITDDAIFVVACDMPFLNEQLMRYMVDKYSAKNKNSEPMTYGSEITGWDAVIPIFEGKPQPLFGIYSKNILGIIEERLNKGLKKLKDMLTEINVLYIKEDEARQIDPEGGSFLNINTMEDLEKVRGGKTCLG